MQRSDYAFTPLSWEQYQAIIRHGSFPDVPEPMLNRPDYDSLIAVMQPADIDPRLPLAFTWAEGHDGTDPGLVAASVNNLGGIKYVGAAGTTDSGIPADTGGTYAAFPDLSVYWREWVRIMNNAIIGPSFDSGDLVGAVEHFTNGPGTGHDKVDRFLAYRRDYPAGGTVAGTGVYGEDLIGIMAKHEGEERSDGTLDPWNMAVYPDHLWQGFCEASVEGVDTVAGLAVVHRGSAAEKGDAVEAQGLLQYSWPPEHGANVCWGRTFDPQGHICKWDATKGMFLSTLFGPSRIGYYYSDAWRDAVRGWFRSPGVVGEYRAQQPAPPPQPVADTWFVDGNPYGAIPVKAPFWPRWDALNTLGTALDHPGAINPAGLAMATFGYPVAPERALATGRRVQQFERCVLAENAGSGDPWDVVVLLLSEAIGLGVELRLAPAS